MRRDQNEAARWDGRDVETDTGTTDVVVPAPSTLHSGRQIVYFLPVPNVVPLLDGL